MYIQKEVQGFRSHQSFLFSPQFLILPYSFSVRTGKRISGPNQEMHSPYPPQYFESVLVTTLGEAHRTPGAEAEGLAEKMTNNLRT